MTHKQSVGIRCVACNTPINGNGDQELCTTCMHVVSEYNSDLTKDHDFVQIDKEDGG